MDENKKVYDAEWGPGRRIDIEVSDANSLWVVAGHRIQSADIWMKGLERFPDLRVRISRIGSTLEVVIDRGAQSSHWWPPDGSPRLVIALDQSGNRASASASAGADDQRRTADLGQVSY